ncbi:MAG: BrnT family toxin [Desulfohalobiaceae bacterium]|nr:BrnT family toxin [Desulfohalobiaceae bacterium]
MVHFEFDEEKSLCNLEKHGIDFYSAQELWKDPDIVEIEAKSEDEQRFLIVGRIMSRHWSAVITYRNERVRLISVRRSRKKEVELYES